MSWNYRVIRKIHSRGEEEEPEYKIHEVYYEEDGTVKYTSALPDSIQAQSLEELREVWLSMGASLQKPVIDEESWVEIEDRERKVSILGEECALVSVRMSLLNLSRLYKSFQQIHMPISHLICFGVDISNCFYSESQIEVFLRTLIERKKSNLIESYRCSRDKAVLKQGIHSGNELSGVSELMSLRDESSKLLQAVDCFLKESKEINSKETVAIEWYNLATNLKGRGDVDTHFSQQMVVPSFSREFLEQESKRLRQEIRNLTSLIDKANATYKVTIFITRATAEELSLI